MNESTIMRRILLSILLVVMLSSSALANTPAPTMEPTPVAPEPGLPIFIPKFSRHEQLPRFKDKLLKQGYYITNASEVNITSDFLDLQTMDALREACKKNGLAHEFSDYGINYNVWDAVMNDTLIPANSTPAPTQSAYTFIGYLDQGPVVLAIQNKLLSLGYPLSSGYASGIYDDATIAAIDLYCQFNNSSFDQHSDQGLSAGLQQFILEGSSNPYSSVTPTPVPTASPTPEPKLGTGEKLRRYFAGSSSLFGLKIPTVALWLISLALIAGCVIAVIYFFSPSDAGSKRSGSEKSLRRPTGLFGGGRLEFTIEYRGIVQTYRCDIDHSLKIGRNVGNFPLNMEDTLISRKHCEIYYSGGSLMLRDYSSNGTRINGRDCSREEYILSSGDVIRIGNHNITIRF